MNNYIQTLVFLLSIHFGFSQNKDIECGYFGKKTVEERNKTFPFNKAKKVILVAFPAPDESIINTETNQYIIIDSLNLSKNGIKIKEVIHLPSKNYIKEYNITEKVELNQT